MKPLDQRIKKFLIVGHPRSGSTFLIEYLGAVSNAFAPNVNHQELFNVYEKLFNACVLQLDGSDEVVMLNSFFSHSTKPWAGLKTIPSFHRQWRDISELPDIQFITITRRDVLSSIASMLISERTKSWHQATRRQLGGVKESFARWFQDRREMEMLLGEALGRLLFDLRCLEQLDARPNTIAICTEDLVDTDFESIRLNEYFEQRIVIQGFRKPTDYRECFDDPEYFREVVVVFLNNVLRNDTFVPAIIRSLLVCN